MSSEPRMPKAKRMGPPDVDPVVIDNVRYEAIHWGRDRGLDQDGGYIGAYDAGSGKELWTLKVYTTKYNAKMERDVQDVFIESLEPMGGRLQVTDERGKRYEVDLASHAVVGK